LAAIREAQLLRGHALTLAVANTSSDNTHRTPKNLLNVAHANSQQLEPEEVAIMEKTSPHGSVVTV
jgi:hypothetical protein